MPISPEMKSKLKALVEDPDVPDNARRAVHEFLGEIESLRAIEPVRENLRRRRRQKPNLPSR